MTGQELTLDQLRGLPLLERCIAAQRAMAEIYSRVTHERVDEDHLIEQARRIEKALLEQPRPELVDQMFEAHFIVVFDREKREDILKFLKDELS